MSGSWALWQRPVHQGAWLPNSFGADVRCGRPVCDQTLRWPQPVRLPANVRTPSRVHGPLHPRVPPLRHRVWQRGSWPVDHARDEQLETPSGRRQHQGGIHTAGFTTKKLCLRTRSSEANCLALCLLVKVRTFYLIWMLLFSQKLCT